MTADDRTTTGRRPDDAGRGDDAPAREPAADPPDGAARPEPGQSPAPEPPPEDGDNGWVPM